MEVGLIIAIGFAVAFAFAVAALIEHSHREAEDQRASDDVAESGSAEAPAENESAEGAEGAAPRTKRRRNRRSKI